MSLDNLLLGERREGLFATGRSAWFVVSVRAIFLTRLRGHRAAIAGVHVFLVLLFDVVVVHGDVGLGLLLLLLLLRILGLVAELVVQREVGSWGGNSAAWLLLLVLACQLVIPLHPLVRRVVTQISARLFVILVLRFRLFFAFLAEIIVIFFLLNLAELVMLTRRSCRWKDLSSSPILVSVQRLLESIGIVRLIDLFSWIADSTWLVVVRRRLLLMLLVLLVLEWTWLSLPRVLLSSIRSRSTCERIAIPILNRILTSIRTLSCWITTHILTWCNSWLILSICVLLLLGLPWIRPIESTILGISLLLLLVVSTLFKAIWLEHDLILSFISLMSIRLDWLLILFPWVVLAWSNLSLWPIWRWFSKFGRWWLEALSHISNIPWSNLFRYFIKLTIGVSLLLLLLIKLLLSRPCIWRGVQVVNRTRPVGMSLLSRFLCIVSCRAHPLSERGSLWSLFICLGLLWHKYFSLFSLAVFHLSPFKFLLMCSFVGKNLHACVGVGRNVWVFTPGSRRDIVGLTGSLGSVVHAFLLVWASGIHWLSSGHLLGLVFAFLLPFLLLLTRRRVWNGNSGTFLEALWGDWWFGALAFPVLVPVYFLHRGWSSIAHCDVGSAWVVICEFSRRVLLSKFVWSKRIGLLDLIHLRLVGLVVECVRLVLWRSFLLLCLLKSLI